MRQYTQRCSSKRLYQRSARCQLGCVADYATVTLPGWECVICFLEITFFSTFTCCEVSSFEKSDFQDYCFRPFLNIDRCRIEKRRFTTLEESAVAAETSLHGCNMLCTGHWCIYFTIFSLYRFVVLLDRD